MHATLPLTGPQEQQLRTCNDACSEDAVLAGSRQRIDAATMHCGLEGELSPGP